MGCCDPPMYEMQNNMTHQYKLAHYDMDIIYPV